MRVGRQPVHGAAIGLLDFAGLLDRSDLRRYIQIQTRIVPDDENLDVEAAWVDWAGLAAAGEEIGPLYGGQERLLRLALSIAHGTPVDLCATLSGLGHEHARAVLDAMVPTLDLSGDVEIADAPGYLKRKRPHDDILRRVLPARGMDPDDESATNLRS
ncbi:hypothetical protein ACFZC5_34315 [Nocardia gamkensis]|uniref:hypothetical protein n=1 Tax=Nocardia gamkensis TaxID=352869 RepID=UPI0036EDB480